MQNLKCKDRALIDYWRLDTNHCCVEQGHLNLILKFIFGLVLIILTFLNINWLSFLILSQLAEGKQSERFRIELDRYLHPVGVAYRR